MTTTRAAILLGLVLVLAGCSNAGTPSVSPSPGGPVTSPEEAEARVKAARPEFAALGPLDPDVIGACCWSEVKAVEGGYQVQFTVGWGDCPAGCINRHVWTFSVAPDGQFALTGEEGPPVPPEVMAGAGA